MIFLKRLKNEEGSILNHPNMIKKDTTNVTLTIGQYFGRFFFLWTISIYL
jgi:hypothetical protein